MQEPIIPNQRKAWIDALRAMSILMVMYDHHAGCVTVFAFGTPVKMPLFFALSGYLFKIKSGGDSVFFKKLFTGVVVPWLCLGVLPIALSFPINGYEHAMTSIKNVLVGLELWFIPCFIVSEAIFYYLLKWSKGKTILLVVFCILASIAGHILRYNRQLDFFMINIAFTVQMYFLFGHVIRKYESYIKPHAVGIGIALLIAYFVIGIVFYPNGWMDVHHAGYSSLPIGLCMAFIGLAALFLLAPQFSNYPKWVSVVGRNTLVIYMLERYAIMPIELAYDFTTHPYWMTSLVTLLFMVWACLLSIGISRIFHRYAPWVTGGRY